MPGRLGQLNAVCQAEVSYSDPRVAAPALWALWHRDQCDFESSVTEAASTAPDRKYGTSPWAPYDTC